LQKWDDLWLKVNYITSKNTLDELFENIKTQKEIVLDTETTSLSIHQADLTGVSICLWKDDLYYINHLHEWEKISREDLQDFLKNVLDLDVLIIGHNIKYDLEVIELFLQKNSATKKAPVDTGAQMTFGI
jgi:DNA polymerase-1